MRLGERYVLGPRLARGGFGEVFLGEVVGDYGFRRPVAIKALADPNLPEIALAPRLRDPHIIEVQDVLVHEGRAYLVMEFADAGTVGRLFRRGRVPAEAIFHIAHSVLLALEVANRQGVVAHRDVTPSNVLLFRDGRVKLADFGIAKVEDLADAPTREGCVKGKLAYVAPEQLDHEPVDGRADLWSLGVVLHELATGRRLFGGRSVCEGEILAAVTSAPIPSLRNSSGPDWLAEFVDGLLSRDPMRRWPSATAARHALETAPVIASEARSALAELIFEAPVGASSVTTNQRPALPMARVEPTVGSPVSGVRLVTPDRPARAKPSTAVVGVLCAALGVGGGVWWAQGAAPLAPARTSVAPVARTWRVESVVIPREVEARDQEPSPAKAGRRVRKKRRLGAAFFQPGGTLPVRDAGGE